MIQYYPVVTGSLTVTGSVLISGSITASGGISISGPIASASYAATASYWSGSINNVLSASYAATATNAILHNGTASAQFAVTSSNTFTGNQYVSATTVPNGFSGTTAAIYTDGGLQVTKDTYLSSSLYIKGNLTVYGTESISYITSSQLNIATNLITVNTSTPAIRFGGLAVQDSGSVNGLTGSLLWDSQNNVWIYTNPSGGLYDGGMVLMGPPNYSATGNEVGITTNALAKGAGSHHMTSSAIFEVSGSVGVGITPSNWDSSWKAIELFNQGNFIGSETGKATWLGSNNIFSGSAYKYVNTNGAGQYILQADGGHKWRVAGSGTAGTTISWTDAMFLSSSGNFGIGTTTPTDPLVVQTNSNSQKNVTFQNTNTTDSNTRQGLYLNAGNRTLSFLTIHNGDNYIQGTIGANLYFQQTAGGTVNMTISSSGYVGIGTTAPAYILDVNGASRFTGGNFNVTSTNSSTYSTIQMQNDTGKDNQFFVFGSGRADVYFGQAAANWAVQYTTSANGLMVGTYNNTNFIVGTNNTERMRVTNGGVVTIGNTNYNTNIQMKSGGSTSYRNMITMDNAVDEIAIIAGTDQGYAYGPFVHLVGKDRYGSNTAGWIDYIAGNASSNTSYGYHSFFTANTLRMAISWNGSIGTGTVGATNIYNPSDVRLKRNIVGVPYGLDAILALNPSKFNWKEKFSPAEEDKDLLGFIAQEVQTVIPEAVESFGQNVHVNTDGVEYTVENPLRVNEKFIIPVLVKALQELNAKFEDYKANHP